MSNLITYTASAWAPDSRRIARHITSTNKELHVGNASQTPGTPHRVENPHKKPPISTSLPD